ncbi:MAG: tryptophan--tRNA ligase, partial [Muribaculaceae bacterium]|nr:tryptophan--tRNA ligase [Muribaculaceae bacterium]
YPVSQAADITAFKATTVPAGDDQSPMIELTREIVNRFNNIYGPTLVEPEILLPDSAVCQRLPGTDGKAKMSKSLGNCIYLSDTPKEVKKKVNSMYTDPEHLTIDSPGHLEGNCPFIYLDAFASDEQVARFAPEFGTLQNLKDRYCRGGVGDGTVKKLLINVLEEVLAPIRERRAYWEARIPEVYDILQKGSEKARATASATLDEVRAAMKINYFSDHKLIAEQAKKYAAGKK